jgi:FG-GAP repeat
LIVGAPLTRDPSTKAAIGAAYAYTYNEIGAQMNQLGSPLKGEETIAPGATGEEFGLAVATSKGFRLAVGAPGNSLLGKDTGRIYTLLCLARQAEIDLALL